MVKYDSLSDRRDRRQTNKPVVLYIFYTTDEGSVWANDIVNGCVRLKEKNQRERSETH